MDELVQIEIEDVYFQLRWPLYDPAHSGVRVMHPLLFMGLEAAGVLAPLAHLHPLPPSAAASAPQNVPSVLPMTTPPPPSAASNMYVHVGANGVPNGLSATQLSMWGHSATTNGVGAPVLLPPPTATLVRVFGLGLGFRGQARAGFGAGPGRARAGAEHACTTLTCPSLVPARLPSFSSGMAQKVRPASPDAAAPTTGMPFHAETFIGMPERA